MTHSNYFFKSHLGLLLTVSFFLLTMGLGLKSPYVNDIQVGDIQECSPLMYWVDSIYINPILSVSIQAVLLFVNFILVYGMIRRYELMPSIDHTSSLIYLILLSVSFPVHGFHTMSIVSILLICAYANAFDCYHQNECNHKIFIATFFYTLASFLLPPLLLMIPLLWMLFSNINAMTFKKVLVSVYGVFLAFFMLAAILFITNQISLLSAYFGGVVSSFGFVWNPFGKMGALFFGFICVLFLIISFFFVPGNRDKNSVRIYVLFLMATWLSDMLLATLFSGQKYTFLMLSYFPFAVLTGRFYGENRFSRLLIWLFLLISIGYFISFFF